MLRQSWIGVVVFLAGLAGPAHGQVKLEWKFKEGDKFYAQTVSNLKMSVDLAGLNKIGADMESTILSSYTVKKVTKDGTVLEHKVESVKVKSGDMLGASLGSFFEQLKGATFTVTLNPAGKVTKVEGYDEFAKDLKGRAKQLLTEDVIKQGENDAFVVLADKAVNKGDTWKDQRILELKMFGTLTIDQELKYQGKGKDGEEIGTSSTISKYTPPKEAALGGLEITKGEFKTDDAKGTVVFDAATGRLVRQQDKLKVKGTLTAKAQGAELMITLELEQSSKTEVMDKPPKD